MRIKRINYLLVVLAALSFTVACKNVNYKKTKSGLLYKIFPGKGKDPLMKNGNVVKYNVVYKLNDDSVLYTSYGKAPVYDNVKPTDPPPYNMSELFTLMKKGDSAVTVQMFDTLLKKGAQIPFATNKEDRLITQFRILEVFPSDSLARPDYEAEMEKDRPRQMKEQEERNAKMQKVQEEAQLKEIEQLEKSGEVGKELKEMESWLAGKKIKAQKTGKGTYVTIQQEGTGPAAEVGKYVNIKYTGKVLATDSIFQSSVYAIQLGKDPPVIRGWTEGLQLFKQGGKGTLYIPGFLAYGANPGPAGKPFTALLFDVEILEVSDKPIAQQQRPAQ